MVGRESFRYCTPVSVYGRHVLQNGLRLAPYMMGMPRSLGTLHYGRHVTLLACLALSLAATRRWHPWHGPLDAAVVYGALHSSALVLSLRASESLPRRVLFVAIAASLAMMSVMASLYGSRFIGILPATARPFLLLSLSSGLGAVSYAALVRRAWMSDLPLPALVWITLGCVSATLAVLVWETLAGTADASLFALAWWFAFSGGLWYNDAYRRGLGRARTR